MDKIEMLRGDYASKLAEAKKLVPESGAMTPEIKSQVDTLLADADGIKSQIETLTRLGEGEKFMGSPLKAPATLAGKVDPSDPTKQFKSFGEMLQTVIRYEVGSIRGDERLDALKSESKATGMNEGVPSEGGFMVQKDHATELLKPMYENGQILSRIDKTGISVNSNGMTFNAIDEVSRATGSRYGGIQAYWLAEAGTKTKSKPTFHQLEMKLKKLIGLCYLTDELLQDAPALEAVVTEAFNNEFTFMTEDACYEGTGVGQPLGILNSPARITVAKEANQLAATVVYENILKMWSRMFAPYRKDAVWHINQDIEPQLYAMSLAVGLGGVPVYLPPNGLSGSPYGMLFGRPVIPLEYCPTLGTEGDISLVNWSQYKAIDKGGIETAQSIHVQFLTDETTLRFVYRFDGLPKWKTTLTPFKGTNTVSPFITLATRA